MKILVTGADGFIGSHLVEKLVRSGFDVRAFVFYNSFSSIGWLDSVKESVREDIEIFSGDIRDVNSVRAAAKNCDAIMHLASLVAIPYSYSSPGSYVETNVMGTLNVMQVARDLGIAKVVHTSTSEVYGTARFVPMTEDHPLNAQSPYSASKIAADQVAMSFYYSFNTPVVIVRPFNTYGPRQSARAVIPAIIVQISSGNRRIKLGAISPTRDFNFVSDTVDGFIAALLSEKSTGEILNLGSNFEISIKETALAVAKIMQVDIEILVDSQRLRPTASEVERLWADNSKASSLLGWTPKYGGADGFRRGLAETITWFMEPHNLSLYRPNAYAI